MGLVEHAVWWHVYPLGAVGAPLHGEHGESVHRLRRLVPWLDHLVALGCNVVLLGPVFASISHGYDTLDHFRIDQRLGEDADFDILIAECRARGIHVVLDGVFNHVSRHHPIVSEHPQMILWEDGHPKGWEGHAELAELDHSNPATRDLVTQVMCHWLERGIAGWRLDVAYAVPTDFWRDVVTRVRQRFPGALFLAEVIHGDYVSFIEKSGIDTLTQYELWKAIWSSLKDRNLWELAHAIERHQGFSQHFIAYTFIGNHDVTRIATQVGHRDAAIAAGVLLTLPGSPSIYYGDEHGFTGTKTEREGGDDEIRPALPDGPGDLSPLGQWLYRIHQQAIGFRRRHPWLATATVEVIDRSNQRIEYCCRNGDELIVVSIDLNQGVLRAVAGDETLTIGGHGQDGPSNGLG